MAQRHAADALSAAPQVRRKGTSWFRRAVPEALRPALGKNEIKCSLHTSNAAEAKRLGLRKAQEVKRLFEAARARAAGPVPNDRPGPVTGTWVPVQHSLPEEPVLRRAVERYPAHLKQFLADRLLSDLGEGPWDEASIAQERRWATVQRQR